MSSNTATAKNTGNTVSSSGTKIYVFSSDWAEFLRLFKEQVVLWHTSNAEQIRDVMFYSCVHGLKGDPIRVMRRLHLTVNDPEEIVFVQVHVGLTRESAERDSIILMNFKKFTEQYGSGYCRYGKFFINGFGHIFGMKRPRRYKNFR